jgi:hypothetical protein
MSGPVNLDFHDGVTPIQKCPLPSSSGLENNNNTGKAFVFTGIDLDRFDCSIADGDKASQLSSIVSPRQDDLGNWDFDLGNWESLSSNAAGYFAF